VTGDEGTSYQHKRIRTRSREGGDCRDFGGGETREKGEKGVMLFLEIAHCKRETLGAREQRDDKTNCYRASEPRGREGSTLGRKRVTDLRMAAVTGCRNLGQLHGATPLGSCGKKEDMEEKRHQTSTNAFSEGNMAVGGHP